jgi:hypothetical protein
MFRIISDQSVTRIQFIIEAVKGRQTAKQQKYSDLHHALNHSL